MHGKKKRLKKKNTNHVDRFDYGAQLGRVARTEQTSVQKLLGYICGDDGYDLSMKEMAYPKVTSDVFPICCYARIRFPSGKEPTENIWKAKAI